MGKREEALQEYEAVIARGEEIAPSRRAVALRGRGFQLIELNRLDEAERAFRDSLQIDPDNELALHEIGYIAHLRLGGEPTATEVTVSGGRENKVCVRCGSRIESGVVQNVGGKLVYVCDRCGPKPKKWWQFWR